MRDTIKLAPKQPFVASASEVFGHLGSDGSIWRGAEQARRATAIMYAQCLGADDTISAAREIDSFMAASAAHEKAMRIANRSSHGSVDGLLKEAEAIRAYLAEPSPPSAHEPLSEAP